MKQLVCSLIVLAAASSCDRRFDYPQTLAVADSLCGVRPDSAVSLLERLRDSVPAFGEEARWYYRHYRKTVTVASDSTLNDVRIVVKSARGNVMCDETVDLQSRGQTLCVPGREGEEKLTINPCHKGEQLTGVLDD